MRHIVSDVADVPLGPPAIDRRRTPDRRTEWQGGRRDSDWTNRPPEALANLERAQRIGALRRMVSSVLHIW
jgi:hypothetical protein